MIDNEENTTPNNGEEHEKNEEQKPEIGSAENIPTENAEELSSVIPVSGLYKDWFLDYASYVILERAVPLLNDGLKPVQRRILHAMNELEDGRYNKVANVIGHAMKYHPHGDASIGDALVQLGQKELLIDCQGNWGNILTGDSAAASRYIEARLSKFALEVVFNPKTTNWGLSYDGRNKEPLWLPIKFPLLLAQGAEGIAVGMACKILPHNFNELIDACIAYYKGKKFTLFPDFPTGGMADVSQYNDGLRGGRVRVRAKIEQVDKKYLIIKDIPFSTTTGSLIESIIKANDKGKLKVKKIEDNTAENVEIVLHIPPGISPDKLIDALYAFTDCEVSISPNISVIESDKPRFIGASEMLKISAEETRQLLKRELEIRLNELEESWHFMSLEKIFIENRIYRDIEEAETWEEILQFIRTGLQPFIQHLKREVTDEDITRLTEIKIKRISRFDAFKADEAIRKVEEGIADVNNDLNNLTEYCIAYFKRLKEKFGKGKDRKTELKAFDNIEATKVVLANKKLYVDRAEGFIGFGLKKDEFVDDCSDIDDIIIFREDGVMQITKIAEKKFVGKGIIHVAVWKKGDKRTIYHMVYKNGKSGPSFMKRFYVDGVTRDKEYDLTQGIKGSSVVYFSENPNGTAEIVSVQLRPRPHLKKVRFELDFGEIGIKSRAAKGNLVTKEIISKIIHKESGAPTLSARKIWFDEVVHRLNVDGRGLFLGQFTGDDRILVVNQKGEYKLYTYDLENHFDSDIILMEKYNPSKPLSAIYWDGEKEQFNVKRFIPENKSREVCFITEHEKSYLELVTLQSNPVVKLAFDKRSNDRPEEEINLANFITVKGEAAIGNRLSQFKVKSIDLISIEEPEPEEPEEVEEEENMEELVGEGNENTSSRGLGPDTLPSQKTADELKFKDIIVDPGKQASLFDE
ncbi:MAG: DNA gyrase/topoisomerase IV subunit A [Luteibaculaceae bacterium]